MIKRVLVIDTSYLDELYQVDGYSESRDYPEIKKRFQNARTDILCIPVTVIFELTNHIAHIKDNDTRRRELAGQLAKHIDSSIKTKRPYTITPCEDFSSLDELSKNLFEFSNNYAQKSLGLTDTSVFLEAKRQRKKYPKNDYLVHIWTRDKKLKLCERELDTEQNPFV